MKEENPSIHTDKLLSIAESPETMKKEEEIWHLPQKGEQDSEKRLCGIKSKSVGKGTARTEGKRESQQKDSVSTERSEMRDSAVQTNGSGE